MIMKKLKMKQKAENKILIITTEGCVACDIMINIITKAINSSNKDIKLEIINHKYLDDKFLKENKIYDFPHTIFSINNKVKDVIKGTIGIKVVFDIIEKVFS